MRGRSRSFIVGLSRLGAGAFTATGTHRSVQIIRLSLTHCLATCMSGVLRPFRELCAMSSCNVAERTSHHSLSVNGRSYALPKRPTVVICLDGFDPAYL